MKVAGQIVVVTGGAHGIGRALCERFASEGANAVVVADIDASGAEATAQGIGGYGFACDVSREDEIVRLIEETEARCGPIGLFCSNAGIAVMDPDWDNPASAPTDDWMRSWVVNVMAHVFAARHLVPRMAARGGGYLLNTVSAAGLLSQIGSGPYSTTKHAALGFAENLAIAVRDRGIRVSVLCPEGVDTAMLRGIARGTADGDGVLTPAEIAEAVIAGLDAERFLILPHPQVATYARRKANDADRWLSGMARLRRSM
ncbi:MAG TPA: SDR family oxidoreductase [Stellaceae bacterium]|jgi:NAD(P)-dependent dehydrogenase (short-subunit alcohol dehydrogenase family)|nr:SDR family oxidoreductase [Stellaceae bacterium]